MLNKEDKETIKRIKQWLDDYPKHKGVVVLWDDETLEIIDIANCSGLHAAEFATKYRDMVLKHVGMSDFMYEEYE